MMKKKWIYSLIIFVLACSFSLSGCKFFYSTKLKAPKIFANENSKVIYWDSNYNATAYEVQMNDAVVGTVKADGDSTQYEFSYAAIVGDFGTFRFRVRCIGSEDYADSDLSEEVVVQVGTASSYLNRNVTSVKFEFDDECDVSNVSVSDRTVTWVKPQVLGISGYLVSIYTNTLGIKHYQTTENSFNIMDSMMSGTDILAIQVSTIINGVNYKSKDLVYFNPIHTDKLSKYTGNIYIFDGAVYDHYIENWTELQNLYYYAFIHRLESVEFRVKESFCEEHQSTYFNTTGAANNYICGSSISAYYETAGFLSSPRIVENGFNCEYKLTCRFGSKEPTKEGTPYYTQDKNYTPYYETVDYTERADDYDEFVSDDWYLSEIVDTSEELFWAVSSHVTPKFSNTTNNAYRIYEKAKEVLRDIISDEMTDYEKALSIFDYIMLNTTYDYNTFTNTPGQDPMQFMCYYLEGVFLNTNNIAVCDGYSKAFALMCNMEGINAVRIMGSAGGGGHAWNKVEIDDNWYVVDLTWTEIQQDVDPTEFVAKEDAYGRKFLTKYDPTEEECAHTYFMVSDKEINTHEEFSNRFVFGLLDANKSYNYYVNDKIKFSDNSEHSRVITSVDQLKNILKNAIIDDYRGLELIIDSDLFYANSGTTEILKSSKPYNFVALEQYSYAAQSGEGDSIFYEGVYYDYYYSSVSLVSVDYDHEDGSKYGILMILKPSITITTNKRLDSFVEFVNTEKTDTLGVVGLSKEKIDEWVGTSFATDEERIEALEEFFKSELTGVESVNITRLTDDVTEDVFTQDEDDNWVEKSMTSADYKFEFTYTM